MEMIFHQNLKAVIKILTLISVITRSLMVPNFKFIKLALIKYLKNLNIN